MFDGIWCAAMAIHVSREDLDALLRGFRRVLRPTGVLGINMQIGRPSEVVEYGRDMRFFEYYRNSEELEAIVRRAGFDLVATDYGETSRNTHELDLTLRWSTLIVRPASAGMVRKRSEGTAETGEVQ